MPPKEWVTKTLAEGLYFGESPRYRDGKLYVSDMTGCKVYAIDEHTGEKNVFVEMEHQPNGMAFLDDGSLICSSMFDAKLYHVTEGKKTVYADMGQVMKGYSGDLVIDKSGRVFIDDTGARVLHGEEMAPGRLLRIDPDRSVHLVKEGIHFPNAICISPDGKTLYNAETFGYGLLKFDLGEDGSLGERQEVWAPSTITGAVTSSFETMMGIDGGCMDADGGIWLSLLGHEEFVRLDLVSGEITDRIKVSGHAVACTLGGEDGKTLFLVVNWQPPSIDIFSCMKELKTRGTIMSVRVDNAHGAARP